jgi:phage FluMu protein gp41
MEYKKLLPKPCRNGNHNYVTQTVFGNKGTIRQCKFCGKTPQPYSVEEIRDQIKELLDKAGGK